MSALLDIATGMTRTWVSLYTSGLPPEFRDSRRAEIDSDVWEQQRTADLLNQPPGETALQLLARLVLGFPSDVTWRLETGRSARSERNISMNGASYMRALVAAGVVLALFLILSVYTGVAWYWVLMITIPIGIAMVAIALFRARQTGGTVGIGVDRMRTKGESRWKWLLLVIGVCVATVVGMTAYAFSLEEWGEARTMIFNLGGLLAVAAGLIATVLLISDLMGSVRRKTGS